MNRLRNTTLSIALATSLVFGLVQTAAADTAGTFTGASDHVTTGGVTVVKNADGTATVTLGADFFLDGAPDPRIGFGANGSFVEGTDVGLLESNTGSQTFTVPASINVDDFNEVYIWCLKFAVPLGVASLS
ncbi:twin-arginine translocation pathway signal protein [Sulfitobacter sp. SK012]|uniref:DM13 domain-containing protein n=1 Tax=Sulfitobacter sp. SK012 TaxID=1389005 RepID=UPI000E0A324A|nr:DM13 domain-containing protein [Sulfitobacter sp. SK012]AXI48428.1 twin-arginine translocation pathway signal protein [Sulfitobacter sp. SK012]